MLWFALMWACDGGSGKTIDPASCAGPHTGAYDGDDEGLVSGELEADGTLRITFGTTFGDVDAEGFVDEDGAVSGTEGAVSIDGTYDGDSCSASGVWVNDAYGTSGTWQIELT